MRAVLIFESAQAAEKREHRDSTASPLGRRRRRFDAGTVARALRASPPVVPVRRYGARARDAARQSRRNGLPVPRRRALDDGVRERRLRARDRLSAGGPAAQRPHVVRGAHAPRGSLPGAHRDQRSPRTRRRFELEYRIQHAEGGIRWVWERGIGLYDAAGNVLGSRASSRTSRSARKRTSRCAKPNAATTACSTTRSKGSSAPRPTATISMRTPRSRGSTASTRRTI